MQKGLNKDQQRPGLEAGRLEEIDVPKICELGPSWSGPKRVLEKWNFELAGLLCFWVLWVRQSKVDLEFEVSPVC